MNVIFNKYFDKAVKTFDILFVNVVLTSNSLNFQKEFKFHLVFEYILRVV